VQTFTRCTMSATRTNWRCGSRWVSSTGKECMDYVKKWVFRQYLKVSIVKKRLYIKR